MKHDWKKKKRVVHGGVRIYLRCSKCGYLNLRGPPTECHGRSPTIIMPTISVGYDGVRR